MESEDPAVDLSQIMSVAVQAARLADLPQLLIGAGQAAFYRLSARNSPEENAAAREEAIALFTAATIVLDREDPEGRSPLRRLVSTPESLDSALRWMVAQRAHVVEQKRLKDYAEARARLTLVST